MNGKTPTDVVWEYLERTAAQERVILVEDYYDLVSLPEAVSLASEPDCLLPVEPTHRTFVARGTLAFRLAYEPHRYRVKGILVIRKRPGCFLPDIEAQVRPAGHLTVTPHWLLRQATQDETWAAEVDNYFELVRDHFADLLTAYAQFRRHTSPPESEVHRRDTEVAEHPPHPFLPPAGGKKGGGRGRGEAKGDPDRQGRKGGNLPLTGEVLLDVLLAGTLGLALWSPPPPAEAWIRCFSGPVDYPQLRHRYPRLAAHLEAWLREQVPPLCWLTESDPWQAVRLLWTAALLRAHRQDWTEVLPRIYPSGFRLRQADPEALMEFAQQVETAAPELATAQRQLVEEALAGPLGEGLVQVTGVDQPEGALRCLQRERHSLTLRLWATRVLLRSWAAQEKGIREQKETLISALREQQHTSLSPALRKHLALLEGMIHALETQQYLAHFLSTAPRPTGQIGLREYMLAYLESRAYLAERFLPQIPALLYDDDLSDVTLGRDRNVERHRQLLTLLFQRYQEAQTAWENLERGFAEAVKAEYPPWLNQEQTILTRNFWYRVVAPQLVHHPYARVQVILCLGLTWDEWENLLAPHLQEVAQVQVQPLLACLPTCWPFSGIHLFGTSVLSASGTGPLPLPWQRWPGAGGILAFFPAGDAGKKQRKVEVLVLSPRAWQRDPQGLVACLQTLLSDGKNFCILLSPHGRVVMGGGFPCEWGKAKGGPRPIYVLTPRCALLPPSARASCISDAVFFTLEELALPPSVFPVEEPIGGVLLALGSSGLFPPSIPPRAGGGKGGSPRAGGRKGGEGSKGKAGNQEDAEVCGGLSLREMIVPCAVLRPQAADEQPTLFS